MKSLYDFFPEEIKRRRIEMGLNRHALAKKMGMKRDCIDKWETGASLPRVDSLCDLADAFGCTTDELLGRGKDG